MKLHVLKNLTLFAVFFPLYPEVELTILDRITRPSLVSGQKPAEIIPAVCRRIKDVTALGPSFLIC